MHRIIAACTVLAFTLFASSMNASAQSYLRDAEIEQYLDDYARPVFETAGLPAESVGIHLIGDPTLNAFVANGLNMYIFTGLITAADTPNEILGVIAHETGHMAGGHLQRTDAAMARASRPMMLSMVLGTVAILAGSPDAGLGLFSLGQTIGTGQFLSYSRGQESAADQAAITYLDSLNTSSEGLLTFFAKLRNLQLLSGRQLNPYYTTHPLANARMAALEQRITESPNREMVDSEEEIFRLKMIQAKIHGFMQSSFVTLRQYPLSDRSAPARYARAVAYYRSSNLAQGLKEIESLIAEQPENPFFYELKGQMLFEHGKIKDSVAPHKKSTDLAPQYALLKVNYARALVALEDKSNIDEAISVLKIALNMEPENVFGWTELARAHSMNGRDDLAALATAEAYFNSGVLHEAHRFATRAYDQLPKNTPESQQAADIVQASIAAAEKFRKKGGNRRR